MLRGNRHHNWFLGYWWECPSPPLLSTPPLFYWLLGKEQACRLDWRSSSSALGHSCRKERRELWVGCTLGAGLKLCSWDLLYSSECYPTRLGSACLFAVKSIHWHQAVVKEGTAFIAWHHARRIGSSYSKDPTPLTAFREGVLKAVWGRGLQSMWSAHA